MNDDDVSMTSLMSSDVSFDPSDDVIDDVSQDEHKNITFVVSHKDDNDVISYNTQDADNDIIPNNDVEISDVTEDEEITQLDRGERQKRIEQKMHKPFTSQNIFKLFNLLRKCPN